LCIHLGTAVRFSEKPNCLSGEIISIHYSPEKGHDLLTNIRWTEEDVLTEMKAKWAFPCISFVCLLMRLFSYLFSIALPSLWFYPYHWPKFKTNMELHLKRVAAPFQFAVADSKGHTVAIDAGPQIGGIEAGFRPMQMLLAGLAGCTSIDILLILQKQKQEVEDYEVKISGTRADTTPAVFTDIHLDIILKGSLDPNKAERAASLSLEKYCSAAAMLGAVATITHTVTILP